MVTFVSGGTRRWHWSADMNGDGLITISDVWATLKWLFFYPGDFCIYVVSQSEGWASFLKRLPQFFETDPPQYGGRLSFVLSAMAWLLVWAVLEGIREDIDRRKRHKTPTESDE